jgi:hypothetical protein
MNAEGNYLETESFCSESRNTTSEKSCTNPSSVRNVHQFIGPCDELGNETTDTILNIQTRITSRNFLGEKATRDSAT